MKQLPNFLSFLRIPLAFAFLQNDPLLRLLAICIAAATDFLDGYLARRLQLDSKFGKVLDPISDKFFVLMAMGAFYRENAITPIEITCMLGRDIALLVFGFYLFCSGKWEKLKVQPILSGKVATTLQLGVLLMLGLKITPSPWIYYSLAVLGVTSLFELFVSCFIKRLTPS